MFLVHTRTTAHLSLGRHASRDALYRVQGSHDPRVAHGERALGSVVGDLRCAFCPPSPSPMKKILTHCPARSIRLLCECLGGPRCVLKVEGAAKYTPIRPSARAHRATSYITRRTRRGGTSHPGTLRAAMYSVNIRSLRMEYALAR